MAHSVTMKIKYNHWLLNFFPKKFHGFTFGQRIFFRKPKDQVEQKYIDHEKVHAAQYKEHGVIGFLYQYLWKERSVPYREKTFEKEAYGDKE